MIIELIEHSRGTLRMWNMSGSAGATKVSRACKYGNPADVVNGTSKSGASIGSLLKAAPWSRRRQSNMGHVLTRSGIFCTGVIPDPEAR